MADGERILITGGAGFLGAVLARDLIADGHEVHLIVRASSRGWRLGEIERQYHRHEADLRDAEAVRKAVAASRPQVIYHLAAHGAHPTQNDSTAILTSNVVGTANLLATLAKHDYRALVVTGSSSEYGHQSLPMCEQDLLAPRTNYGVSKAAATLLCQAEAYLGRPVTTVRVFSPYGAWDEPTRLVPYVIGCCLRGEAPRVTNGFQPRDFIYVDDVVRLLKLAANCSDARGQILHAGSGRQSSVREMVETIVATCGRDPAEIKFGEELTRKDEPQHWVASIERTTMLTGWRPLVDLRTGIERTWRWAQMQAVRSAA